MADSYDQIYTYILYAFTVGIGIGVIYDLFRIVRMAFTMPWVMSAKYKKTAYKSRFGVDMAVFICDVLFFVITAAISAIFIFYVNNGRIRGIALTGSLVGFILYYNTLGRLVTLISGGILRFFYASIAFFVTRLLWPTASFISGCLRRVIYLVCYLDRELYTLRDMRRQIKIVKKGKGNER